METDWIQTFTGKAFYPLEPHKCIEKICIEDIAWALSMQCRFAGHCKRFYSVAEHSVHLSYAVPEEFALEALMHDASEAYLVDIPRPLKPFLPKYKEWEESLMSAIAQRFRMSYPFNTIVYDYDSRILVDERSFLMTPSEQEWNLPFKGLGIGVQFWDQLTAYSRFIGRFRGLVGWDGDLLN